MATIPRNNWIENPFTSGSVVRLPAGTVVRRPTKPRSEGQSDRQALTRAQTVKVHHATPGWVDRWGEHTGRPGTVMLPTISWAGSGGYWVDVKVTPELCEAAGIPIPELPAYDPQVDSYSEPQYGLGYDNREPAVVTG